MILFPSLCHYPLGDYSVDGNSNPTATPAIPIPMKFEYNVNGNPLSGGKRLSNANIITPTKPEMIWIRNGKKSVY